MRKFFISTIVFIFLINLSYVYADDNQNISYADDVTMTCNVGGANCNYWIDQDDSNQWSNAGYPGSAEITFDDTKINCYVTNMSIKLRINQGEDVFISYLNATTRVWSGTWRTLSGTGPEGATVFKVNVSTGEGTGTGIGACGFKFTTGAGSFDWQGWELGIINGSNVTVDTIPPVIKLGINDTSPKIHEDTNISFNVTGEPTDVNVTINFTTGLVIKNYTTTEDVDLHNITSIIDARGNVLNISVCAVDSSDNYGCNSTKVTIADTIGTITIGLNLSEIFINNAVNVSGNISEPDGDIDYCMIGHNQSGLMVNTTYEDINCSQSVQITLAEGGVVNFTTFYNTSGASGATLQNSTKITVSDTVGSIQIGFNGSTYRINDVINISGNISEPDGDIEFCMVSHNQSGIHANTTFVDINCSQAITITLVRNAFINFTTFYNTSGGFTLQNSTTVEIANTNPTVPNCLNASDTTVRTNVSLNCTSTDADSDILSYAFWFYKNDGVAFYSNYTNFTTNMDKDTTYYMNVSASDGIVNTTNSSAWNITLDTTIPLLDVGLPVNGTAYSSLHQTLHNITVECSDNNIFEFNTTSYNISDDGTQTLISSNTTFNLTPQFISKRANFTINTSWGDGSVNVSIWCGDTKNQGREFKSGTHGVSDDNRTIYFNDSRSGVKLNLTIDLEGQDKIKKDYNGSENIVTTVQDFGSKTSGIYADYYKYTIAINLQKKDDYLINKFVTDSQVIEIYDDLPNHLLFGSGKEKVSLDAKDLVDAGFLVETVIIDGYYAWRISNNEMVSTDGERIEFDPRIDNLHIVEQSNIQVIDTIFPILTQVFPVNGTYFTTSTPIINFTVTDSGNSGDKAGTADLYSNFSGIFKLNQSMKNWNSTVKQGFNITTAIADGVYIIAIIANDTAGNFANTTNISIQVDANAPVILFNDSQHKNDTIINGSAINITIAINETFVRNITFALFNGTDRSLTSNLTFTVSQTNVTFAGLGDGYYLYNVTSFDQGNLSASTQTRNLTVDANGPVIIVSTPLNASNINNQVTYSYNVSHFSGVESCTVIRGTTNVSNVSSISNPNIVQDTVENLAEATYNWNINCSDNLGRQSKSGTFEYTIVPGTPTLPGGSSGSSEQIAKKLSKIDELLTACDISVEPTQLIFDSSRQTLKVRILNRNVYQVQVNSSFTEELNTRSAIPHLTKNFESGTLYGFINMSVSVENYDEIPDDEFANLELGFSRCSIDKIEIPITVIGDKTNYKNVTDQSSFFKAVENLPVLNKLFSKNTGNAITTFATKTLVENIKVPYTTYQFDFKNFHLMSAIALPLAGVIFAAQTLLRGLGLFIILNGLVNMLIAGAMFMFKNMF
mgnify:CR=1 FL=1|jgi:hypothetical protein|tara:strand:- start:653 stop:4717 length:4065 start_codon:yes stop_codon:yes gene_type:complete